MGRFLAGPTQRVKVRLAFGVDVSVFADEKAEEPRSPRAEILSVDVVVEVEKKLQGPAREDAARAAAVEALEGALSGIDGLMQPGML